MNTVQLEQLSYCLVCKLKKYISFVRFISNSRFIWPKLFLKMALCYHDGYMASVTSNIINCINIIPKPYSHIWSLHVFASFGSKASSSI